MGNAAQESQVASQARQQPRPTLARLRAAWRWLRDGAPDAPAAPVRAPACRCPDARAEVHGVVGGRTDLRCLRCGAGVTL